MGDQFLPGWQPPPGIWPYAIQDMLTALLPAALQPKDAGNSGSSIPASMSNGGLVGILAAQSARSGSSASGWLGTAMRPANRGILGALAPPDDGWHSGALHWLQRAVPFGLGSPRKVVG